MVRNEVELRCTYKHYMCFCDGQFWWWFIAQFSYVKWKINEIWERESEYKATLWIFQEQIFFSFFTFRIASDLFPIFYASGNELYFWEDAAILFDDVTDWFGITFFHSIGFVFVLRRG